MHVRETLRIEPAGDLVATVVAEGSRNRRAGELLGQGMPAESIGDELGQSSEALDGVGQDKDFIEDYRRITGEEPDLVGADEVSRIFERIRAVDPEVKRVLEQSRGKTKAQS